MQLTRTRKIVIGVLIAVSIAAVALTAGGVIIWQKLQKTDCYSPECLNAAVVISKFIYPDIEACEDIYSYSCLTFLRNSSRTVASRWDHEKKRFAANIDSFLTLEASENDSATFAEAKKFYRACLDTDAIEKESDAALLHLLGRIGGWPVLIGDDWGEEEFRWEIAAQKARRSGLHCEWFIKVDYTSRGGNETIQEAPPNIYVRRIPQQEAKFHSRKMTDIAVGLGADRTRAEKEMADVLSFEQELALVITRHSTLVPAGLSSPDLYFKSWVAAERSKLLKAITTKDTTVPEFNSTNQRSYVRYLKDVFRLLDKTDKRVRGNYVGWKIIESFIPLLSEYVRGSYAELEAARLHVNKSSLYKSREEVCKDIVRDKFDFVVEREVIKSQENSEIEQIVTEMVQTIAQRAKEHFENITWAESVATQFANFPSTPNVTLGVNCQLLRQNGDSKLQADGFSFRSKKVVDMFAELTKHNADAYYARIKANKMQQYRDDVSECIRVIMSKIKVDSNFTNIEIPLRFYALNSTWFDPNRPNYLNYAGLGGVIAYALAEAYVLHLDTINDTMLVNGCIVKEYKTYDHDLPPLDAWHFKGVYSTSLGTDFAFEAYQDWVDSYGEESKIYNVTYTPNQLFWLESLTLECYKQPRNSSTVATRDIENYSRFLIDQVAKNSMYFWANFNCTVGTIVNPETKCALK